MKYETFVEKFNELPIDTKIAINNEYCIEYGYPNETLEPFDENFFDTFFENNPMEAARAVFFGSIENWADDYIKFNVYGNLESVSKYTAENIIEDNIEEIFEHKEIWQDYIDDDEEDNEDGEYICPNCGHVFKQGEYNYNYDTALLDFVCPDCDWEGNEKKVERNTDEE